MSGNSTKIFDLSGLTLEDLLPHRPPMLLVERVLAVDSRHARTLSRVNRSWPMAEVGGIHPLILLELAAQTAGVCSGWDRIRTRGLESDKSGWLVGIKKTELDIDLLPYDGEVISEADHRYSFENLREVECEQWLDGRLIATTTLQLYQK